MAKDSLKTLIRLAKFNVDEKRRTLQSFQAREDEIVAAMRNDEERLKEEQRVAAADATGVGFLYGAYAGAWITRRDELARMLEAVRQEIQRARDELAEAFGELKTYEITQRERERRAKAEADKKEQAFLDEIGQNIHRRQGGGEAD
jgi:flagellar protein FliJ